MGQLTPVKTLEKDAEFNLYRADPSAPPRGAIVVIQEVFGVNAGIRARCDRWAEAGYLSLAPDLFWRIEPGIELDPDVPEDFKQGLATMQRFVFDTGMRDIEAAIRYARGETDGGKVGVVGYCLGGGLAFLAATRTDADAAVGYYGAPIPGYLGESHAIGRPTLLHFAGTDHFIGPDKLAQIHTALDPNPHVTIEEYAGVDHGFATESGKRRDDAAARLADGRTADFFAEHIG